MPISIDVFESITDKAFDFLVSDFGYQAEPAKRSGLFKAGFLRRFECEGRAISMLFADVDSPYVCQIFFNDGLDAGLRQYRTRSLAVLLENRFPDYVHKSLNSLSESYSAADAISEYAALLHSYGADVVEGDFSAFPPLVYLLNYVEEKYENANFVRPIGIFSTLDNVAQAIEKRRQVFAEHEDPDGYRIWRMDIK